MLLGRILLLLFGVLACSTAVIMIKASETHPVLLSGARLWIAALALTPAYLRARRRHRSFGLRHLRATLLPGVLLAVHFITWIIGARLTYAANSSLIVNLVPVAMPFLLYAVARERIHAGERLGTAVAISGAVLLGAADFHLDRSAFIGDVVCLFSMLFFAAYLLFGRQNRHFPSLWLYVVPLYYVAGMLCVLPVPWLTVAPIQHPVREVLLILGIGLIPTVLGHSILLRSMKHLRPQSVAICNLGQFVFAGLLAYGIFGERPAALFYIAGLLLVAGAVIAIRHQPPAATAIRPAAAAAP